MKFVEGTWYHYLYILSPFITIAILYMLLNKKSDKIKYNVGLVIGILSLLCLTVRNVDILIRNGFSPQAIPLQVCHFGNIVVFVALAFRNKTAAAMAWTLNLIPAFSSLVIADALANYKTVLAIRPQAYIWGHYLIIIGALYPVILSTIKFERKHFYQSLAIGTGLFVVSLVLNTVFNDLLNMSINYFYAYNSSGVPFQMFYNLAAPITIGSWFTINLVYVLFLVILGLTVIWLMYGASRLVYKNKKLNKA